MNSVDLMNLNLKFGNYLALKDVNVSFERGKIHGIVGRNGSGKTVLFKCICGLLTDYSGKIMINGEDRRRLATEKANIGMIIEAPGFVTGYSGYRNLRFLADIRHTIKKEDIMNAMRTVGLDPSSKKHVEKYSMGMRQRLGIAQAIMEGPDMLILDEPMNGLDNAGVADMRDLFSRMRDQGKTLILASHNPLDIETLCDTVCEMDAGVLTRKR